MISYIQRTAEKLGSLPRGSEIKILVVLHNSHGNSSMLDADNVWKYAIKL